eukprot:scaffold119465_cov55-Phaeocystis_antarctica.AAC.3
MPLLRFVILKQSADQRVGVSFVAEDEDELEYGALVLTPPRTRGRHNPDPDADPDADLDPGPSSDLDPDPNSNPDPVQVRSSRGCSTTGSPRRQAWSGVTACSRSTT